MPVPINRNNSVISIEKKIQKVADYLEPLLAANTPIEIIEEVLLEEIDKLQEQCDAATNSSDKRRYETSISNRKNIIEDLKKEKEIDSAINEFNEENQKLAEEYNITLNKCEELFDYIANIDLDVQKDFTKLKKAIVDKITIFSAQIIKQSNQRDAVNQAFEKIEKLKPRYEVVDSCSKKIAKFNAKSFDWVKQQYIAGLKKIKELESKREKISYIYDQKKISETIKVINETLNEDLGTVLENPKDIERIKKEAYKELGIDIEKEKVVPPLQKNNEAVQRSENTPKKAETAPTTQHESSSNQPNVESEVEKPIVTRPVKTKDSDDFQAAKIDYLAKVNLINKHIQRLEDLNDKQDEYAEDPIKNLDKMISTYQESNEIRDRIFDLKGKLLDLEYEKYINEHIILTLDEDVKNAKIKKIEHNLELEEFMARHNFVIKTCYENLQAIAQQDYTKNSELQSQIKRYKDIIDIQHILITKRLVEERENDKNFDIVKYRKEHKVDIKKIDFEKKVEQVSVQPEQQKINAEDVHTEQPVPVSKQENTPFVTNSEPDKESIKPNAIQDKKIEKDNRKKIEEIKKYLVEYQKDYIQFYALLKVHETEIGLNEENRATLAHRESVIKEAIKKMQSVLENAIQTSGLSQKKKSELFEEYKKLTISIEEGIKNVYNSNNSYIRLTELKKDIEPLLTCSQELVRLSEFSIFSEEYISALDKFNQDLELLKTKYSDLKLKVSKPNSSSVRIEYICDGVNKKACNISLKSKNAKKDISLAEPQVKKINAHIKETKLLLKDDVIDVNRNKSLIATISKIKITLLKQKLKVEYTKQLVEDLKKMKIKLEIQASGADKARINVSQAKDSKDQKKEYRYIDNIEDLSSAQIIYRNMDTNEEIMSYELLNDEDIQKELENRRTMK